MSLSNVALGGAWALVAVAALAGPAGAADPGLELQLYPAGLIATGFVTRDVGGSHRLGAHAGVNVTRRGDFGRHEDERGEGPGLGVSWHRALRSHRAGWQLGLRLDLWFLSIDWEDPLPARTGRTDVVVLQPTGRVGYRFAAGDRIVIEPALSLGAEINVRTAGEEVGEGAILLLGVGATWRR